jgi:protein-disulfide isomerase
MAPDRRIALVAVAFAAALGLHAASSAAPSSSSSATASTPVAPAPSAKSSSAAPAASSSKGSLVPEESMGDPKAKVTLIEYASAACPHCARMNNDVLPQLKKTYIDTGKVRYVFREMLTGDPNLAAAGFVTARCAPPAKYFDVVHAIMAQQEEIYRGRQLRPPLVAIAKSVGLSEAALDACLNDPKSAEAAPAVKPAAAPAKKPAVAAVAKPSPKKK